MTKLESIVLRLEDKQNTLESSIKEIKDNHLVHLAADIKELQDGLVETNLKIAYWAGGAGAMLALLQLILKFWH